MAGPFGPFSSCTLSFIIRIKGAGQKPVKSWSKVSTQPAQVDAGLPGRGAGDSEGCRRCSLQMGKRRVNGESLARAGEGPAWQCRCSDVIMCDTGVNRSECRCAKRAWSLVPNAVMVHGRGDHQLGHRVKEGDE